MKKIVLPLMALIFSANVFVSCSNEDSNDGASQDNTSAKGALVLNSVNDTYLGNFYQKSVTYGKSVQTKDENGTGLVVTEVIVGSDTTPRGYIVNRSSDNELLYFADFDKTNDKMTSIDVVANETDIMTGVNDNEYYIESGGDIISIIEASNTATNGLFIWVKWVFTMDNFWGTTRDESDPCGPKEINGTFQNVHDVTISKRVFWIRWKKPQVLTDVPC